MADRRDDWQGMSEAGLNRFVMSLTNNQKPL